MCPEPRNTALVGPQVLPDHGEQGRAGAHDSHMEKVNEADSHAAGAQKPYADEGGQPARGHGGPRRTRYSELGAALYPPMPITSAVPAN